MIKLIDFDAVRYNPSREILPVNAGMFLTAAERHFGQKAVSSAIEKLCQEILSSGKYAQNEAKKLFECVKFGCCVEDSAINGIRQKALLNRIERECKVLVRSETTELKGI